LTTEGADGKVEAALGIETRVLDSWAGASWLWGVVQGDPRLQPRMAEVTGIRPEEALGRGVMVVFAHIQGLDFEALDAEIRLTGGFESRSLRLVRPGGEVVYRHLRGDVLQGCAGDGEEGCGQPPGRDEREFLRQSMRQYLAPEVADLVLASRPESPSPAGSWTSPFSSPTCATSPRRRKALPRGALRRPQRLPAPMVEIVAGHGG